MRRFLARVLRNPDLREEHLIEAAMRTTPRPVPPAGLRDRLVADALAAADQVSPQRRMSHAWMAALAAPAAVLVIVVAWLAFAGHGAKRTPATRTGPEHMVTGLRVQTPPQPVPGEREVVKEPALENEPEVRKPAHQPNGVPKHRSEPIPNLRKQPVEEQPEIETNEEPGPEQPVIVVKVGPRREGEISYARAAARDENGVRTEWAIYVGDEPHESRQEMCISDSEGRGFCLTTTSSNNLTNRLEETL